MMTKGKWKRAFGSESGGFGRSRISRYFLWFLQLLLFLRTKCLCLSLSLYLLLRFHLLFFIFFFFFETAALDSFFFTKKRVQRDFHFSLFLWFPIFLSLSHICLESLSITNESHMSHAVKLFNLFFFSSLLWFWFLGFCWQQLLPTSYPVLLCVWHKEREKRKKMCFHLQLSLLRTLKIKVFCLYSAKYIRREICIWYYLLNKR